jgi:HEAT repeat protein
MLQNDDSAVRYWAAMGMVIRGARAVEAARDELRAALEDPSPDVRIAAAEALIRYAAAADRKSARDALVELASWEKHDVFTALAALNAIDAAGDEARTAQDAIKKLPSKGKLPSPRYAAYVPRLIEDLLAKWK